MQSVILAPQNISKNYKPQLWKNKNCEVCLIIVLASPCQFYDIMLGNFTPAGIQEFWAHIKTKPEWAHHTVLHAMDDQTLQRSVPCSLHTDGVQMYRDDEFYVYSWCSTFSVFGNIHDVLMQKFPICIVPEREMLDENVT